MNSYLRQATVSQTRLIGPFIDDTDFKTPETSLTIANTDIKLSINGGASANKNSGGATHIINGEYAITLDATDTATVGELTVSVSVSGALLAKKTFWVLEEAIYDALFAASATGLLPANVTQISGDSGAADNLELAYDGTGYDVGGIDVSELNQIVDDLLNGGRLDLLVDAIKAKTDSLAFTTAGKVDARVDYVGTNAVTSPDDFKATSVTVSDKTGFSLAADQSGVTIGTVNAMAGTITTLDALDAAQDSQHSTTQSAIGALNNIAATDIVSAGPITTLSGAVVNVDTVDTCTTNTDMRGTDNALLAANTPANFAALGINVSGHVSRVTLVDTTTTNTDMRGTDGANTTTPPSVSAIRTEIDSNSAQLAAILQDTGTTLPAQITLAQNDLDILTGTDGATLSTASTTAIGTGFLSTALTKGTAGTIERAFWQILKTQAIVDGTVVADVSNTVNSFYTTLTNPDGHFDHMVILFTSNGLEGEARPIHTYAQSNGVITLQEPLSTVPSGDEEFIILPQHVHPMPANFENLDINSSGHIERVTLVDTTTVNTDFIAPDNASIAEIKEKTNQLTFTNSGNLDASIYYVGATGVSSPNDFKADVAGLSTLTTSDIDSRLSVFDWSGISIGGVSSGVTVTTNNDKTGYSLTGSKTTLDDLNDIPATGVDELLNRATSARMAKLDITGTLANSDTASLYRADVSNIVLPSSGLDNIVTFPNNFSALGINSSGDIERVSVVDLNSDMRGTDGANTVAPDNTSIAQIKTKTDQLSFTNSGNVDASIYYVASSSVSTPDDFKANLDASSVWAYETRTLTSAANITSDSGLVDNLFDEIKGAGWSNTDTLEGIRDAVADIDTGTGTGSRSVIIRVNDGSTPIQNAKVRLYLGIENYRSLTDVNGDTTAFGLENDGTWNIVVTAPGYTSYVGTLSIIADIAAGEQVYSLTQNVITPPSDPAYCRVTAYVQYNGQPEQGATFKAILSGRNVATDGIVVNQNVSATTDSDGYAYLDLIRQDQIVDGTGSYEINLFNSSGRLIFRTNTTIPNSGVANLEDLI